MTINFSIYTDTVLRGYRDLSERANELNRHQHLPDSRDKVHRGKRRRICDAILRAGGVATRSTASPLKIIPPPAYWRRLFTAHLWLGKEFKLQFSFELAGVIGC